MLFLKSVSIAFNKNLLLNLCNLQLKSIHPFLSSRRVNWLKVFTFSTLFIEEIFQKHLDYRESINLFFIRFQPKPATSTIGPEVKRQPSSSQSLKNISDSNPRLFFRLCVWNLFANRKYFSRKAFSELIKDQRAGNCFGGKECLHETLLAVSLATLGRASIKHFSTA